MGEKQSIAMRKREPSQKWHLGAFPKKHWTTESHVKCTSETTLK